MKINRGIPQIVIKQGAAVSDRDACRINDRLSVLQNVSLGAAVSV
jgi:hypothetical protein